MRLLWKHLLCLTTAVDYVTVLDVFERSSGAGGGYGKELIACQYYIILLTKIIISGSNAHLKLCQHISHLEG